MVALTFLLDSAGVWSLLMKDPKPEEVQVLPGPKLRC